MKETKDFSKNKGITLIALVITIIVMLILVGVTISIAVNGGLFDYAGKASGQTKNALNAEQELANGGIEVNGKWYNNIDEYLNKDKKEVISKEKSYIGCYADVDGDGTVDGVIYADLAFSKEGSWGDYSYSYEAETAEELKNYYISGIETANFYEEAKEVLTAIGEGKDRFYVLALEDFTEGGIYYRWYHNAYENDNTQDVTADEFGTGKANTVAMIEKWNAEIFGTKNGDITYKDVWGAIQESEQYDIAETVNDSAKWFLPSAGEWAAFAHALDVHSVFDEEYSEAEVTCNFSWDYYWTSSQSDSQEVRQVSLGNQCYYSDILYSASIQGFDPALEDMETFSLRVRLNATF